MFACGQFALGLSSCRHQAASVPRFTYGGITLGHSAAAAFGLREGSTLPEREAGGVPPSVQRATKSLADSAGQGRACSRFFEAGDRFVVLFAPFCGTGLQGKQADAALLVLLGSDGTRIGSAVHWRSRSDIRSLTPFTRQVP